MNPWVYRWPRVALVAAIILLPVGMAYALWEAVPEAWREWRKVIAEIRSIRGLRRPVR